MGSYPLEAVNTMRRLAADVETTFPHELWLHRFPCEAGCCTTEEAVSQVAVELAEDVGATAVITCTYGGTTARMVAKRRPQSVVLAVTPSEKTARRLSVLWGVKTLLMDEVDSFETIERAAITMALQEGVVQPGESLVLTAGLPFHVSGVTNLIKVATAEWA